MSRWASFVVLAAAIAITGYVFFQVMAYFFVPMFLAVILVVLFRPLHQWYVRKCHGRVRLAAGLTTLSTLLVVLIPILLIIIFAASETVSLFSQFDQRAVLAKIHRFRQRNHLEFPSKETFGNIEDALVKIADDPSNRELSMLLGNTYLRKIARDHGLTVPDADDAKNEAESGDESVPLPTQAAFNVVWQKWEELDESLDTDPPPEIEQHRAAVADLSAALVHLREQLSGGRFLYWIKSQANPTGEQVDELRGRALTLAGSLALQTPKFVGGFLARWIIGLAVLVISFYYFLADGPEMVNAVMRLSPLDDRYELQMINEFDRISRAVVMAALLSAFVQGVLAGFAYYLVGMEVVFLLTFLTMLLALVPFVGAAAVWIPCSLWLWLYEERTLAAALLAIYGVAVVSMADNVIKPVVLHGQSNMHPLMALLSVLGGVQALGPIGILIGPMIVALLQAMLNILRVELQNPGEQSPPGEAASPAV